MNAWLRDLSLARKLTLLATATSAVSMTVFAAAIGSHDAAAMRARLVNDTEVLVDMVGANSTGALSFEDAAAATELLRAAGVNGQINVAALLLPDGRVLGRYDRQPASAGQPAPLQFDADAMQAGRLWHEFRTGVLAMTTPTVLNDEVIGTVYVEVSLAELQERLVTLWRFLGATLGGMVLLASLIAWRLQRIISAPVVQLTTVARSVTREGNYAIRAPIGSHDEIGELVSGFNEMLDGIQRRDAALESHRQELERTVSARTAELKASVDRYRLLVESTHAVPWEIDGATWAFSYISPHASILFGYPSQQLMEGMSLPDLVYPDDRSRVLEQLQALVAAASGNLDLEYRVLTASNTGIDVRSVVTAHGASTDGSVVLRGITIDVTEQKRLELELRQAQKLESVGRLAAGVAHEINTPIQFVSDSIYFVRDALNDMPALLAEYEQLRAAVANESATPEAAAHVQQAAEAADLEYLLENVPKALERSLDGLSRVATIVRSMKEFAHPDQKEMAPLDLSQALRSTLTIARNEYKYVAEVDTDFDEVPAVICHGGEINQVMLNIIVNAAHAIEGVVKGTNDKGLITVQTRREADCVAIRISDTGGGIPKHVQERMFDPFFTTKGVGKGTGQGLAIARSVIIEKHQGELTFETRPGIGTTFIIRLPIEGSAAARARDTSNAA